jgi:hypothetical protein
MLPIRLRSGGSKDYFKRQYMITGNLRCGEYWRLILLILENILLMRLSILLGIGLTDLVLLDDYSSILIM